MSARILGFGLVLLAVAPGAGQLPPDPRVQHPVEADPFTAFPKLVPPPPGAGGAAPRGGLPKLVIPANASPLEKVRIAQVHQAESFLVRHQTRIELGQFDGSDWDDYCRLAAELARTRAELAPDAAGKVAAHEAAVLQLKALERALGARVQAGVDRPNVLNLVRFWRLQAEKELLVLQDELAKAGKK